MDDIDITASQASPIDSDETHSRLTPENPTPASTEHNPSSGADNENALRPDDSSAKDTLFVPTTRDDAAAYISDGVPKEQKKYKSSSYYRRTPIVYYGGGSNSVSNEY